MKILRVGDPHITVRNIKEAEKLIDFIMHWAQNPRVDRVEFMGDQFHTHAVMRVEVIDFWKRTFEKFNNIRIPAYALVGNHDKPGSKEKEQEMNAMSVFKSYPYVTIIDRPMYPSGKIAYIPHMSDTNAFIEEAKRLYSNGYTECLIAHQTFTGAQYENGFYAPDGIDPELIPQKQIISGHIHKCQEVGKCFYVGTAKWDSMSDANEDKGIWIFDHNEDGSVKSKKFVSTEEVVTPIRKITMREGDDIPKLEPNARNYVELLGSSAWIKQMKKHFKGKAQIKARPTDRKMVKLDRNKSANIVDFLNNDFEQVDGVNKKDILNYLNEVGIE